MNDLDFSGKTVLVVGGSSGIGNGIAQGYRARGADVHVWGTRPAAADYDPADGSDLSGLKYARMDISDIDGIAAHEPAFDRLDILVLSQGTVLYNRQEFQMDGWQKVMDVNINSVMACCARFHPMLAASGGSVVIISSVTGFVSAMGNPAYAASKTAAVGLTRTLGEAWAADGIRVNGVAPGLVATKLTKVTTENPKRLAATQQAIPLRRLGEPSEIAGAVMFLTSPLASYVVGQTLLVDGGLTLS